MFIIIACRTVTRYVILLFVCMLWLKHCMLWIKINFHGFRRLIWFDLIDLIYGFKLWHSAKPFFHARVHKVTTYNTSTSNKLITYSIQYKYITYNITHTTYNDNLTSTTYNDNIQLQHTTTTYTLNTYRDCDEKSISHWKVAVAMSDFSVTYWFFVTISISI